MKMADNRFDSTVEALFKGMDGFLSTKTVVGDAVRFDDGTIILPLVDVSFGVGAGAWAKQAGDMSTGGGLGGGNTGGFAEFPGLTDHIGSQR